MPFALMRRDPLLGLRQLRFRGRRARNEFRAALFVGSNACLPAIAFDQYLVEPLAILPRLRLDRITALRALRVLGLRLHAFALPADFLAQLVNLRIKRY